MKGAEKMIIKPKGKDSFNQETGKGSINQGTGKPTSSANLYKYSKESLSNTTNGGSGQEPIQPK